MPLTLDDKRALCGHRPVIDGREVRVTLEGKKATIMGAMLDFAKVAQLPNGLEAEYAWGTVLRILTREKNPGAFK